MRKGELKFTLYGQKLRGSWVLVRTRFGRSGKPQWLLIKHRDQYASSEDIESEEPRSIASNRFMSDIARADHGNVKKAAKVDPDSCYFVRVLHFRYILAGARRWSLR